MVPKDKAFYTVDGAVHLVGEGQGLFLSLTFHQASEKQPNTIWTVLFQRTY